MYEVITKRLNNIEKDLAKEYYCIAPILNNMKMRPSTIIPTLAVDFQGRGLYNPIFIQDRTDSEIKFLLMHEAFHILLQHTKRFTQLCGYTSVTDLMKDNDPKLNKQLQLFNIAADGIINDNIQNSTNYWSEGGVTLNDISEKINIPLNKVKKMSTESIYKKLAKVAENDNNNNDSNNSDNNDNEKNQSNKNNNSNKDSQDDTSSDNSQSNSSSSQNNNSSSAQSTISEASPIDEMKEIEKAYKKATKSEEESNNNNNNNNENTNMEEAVYQSKQRIKAKADDTNSTNNRENLEIDKVLKATSTNWKKVLKNFTNELAGKGEKHRTWKRPSRKYRTVYPISQGYTKTKQKDLIFSIDVSGSMDEEKISKAVELISSYTKHNKLGCKYFFFSNYASKLYKFEGMKKFIYDLKKQPSSGTSYTAALGADYFKKNTNKGLVIISDMEFSFDSQLEDIEKQTNNRFVFLNVNAENQSYYITEVETKYKNTKHYTNYI